MSPVNHCRKDISSSVCPERHPGEILAEKQPWSTIKQIDAVVTGYYKYHIEKRHNECPGLLLGRCSHTLSLTKVSIEPYIWRFFPLL